MIIRPSDGIDSDCSYGRTYWKCLVWCLELFSVPLSVNLYKVVFNSGSIPTTYCLFISHLLVCEHCACVHSSYTFCHFQFGRFICSKTTIYKQISCHATNLSLIHHILFLLIHFIIPHQTFDSPPSHPNSLNTPLTLILLTPTHIQPPL